MVPYRRWVWTSMIAWSLACGTAGCGGSVPAGFSRHRSRDKACAVAAPKSWSARETADFLSLLSPVEGSADSFRENVVIAVGEARPGTTTAQHFRDNVSELERDPERFRVHETGASPIQGREVPWVLYSHRMGDVRLKAIGYYPMSGSRGYVVTCTALETTFPALLQTFRQIAATLQLE